MLDRRRALAALTGSFGTLGMFSGAAACDALEQADQTAPAQPAPGAMQVLDAGVAPVWLNGDPNTGTILNGRQMFQAAIDRARTEVPNLGHYNGRQVTWNDDVTYRWDGPVVIRNTYHLALV